MPIIEMHLMEGRSSTQKHHMAEAVTEAIVQSLGVTAQSVRILITEHKDEEFYVGGETITQRQNKASAGTSISVSGENTA